MLILTRRRLVSGAAAVAAMAALPNAAHASGPTVIATVGVQPSVFQSGSGTSAAINTTGANALFALKWGVGGPTPLPQDSASNTWQNLPPKNFTPASGSASGYVGVAVRPIITNAAHTFQVAGGFSPGLLVSAWSGFTGTAQPDQDPTGTSNASSTSLACGSITPGVNNAVIFAFLGGDFTGTVTIDSGFTILGTTLPNNPGAGTSNGVAWAYLFQATPSAVNPTWSWTGPASNNAAKVTSFGGDPIITGHPRMLQ